MLQCSTMVSASSYYYYYAPKTHPCKDRYDSTRWDAVLHSGKKMKYLWPAPPDTSFVFYLEPHAAPVPVADIVYENRSDDTVMLYTKYILESDNANEVDLIAFFARADSDCFDEIASVPLTRHLFSTEVWYPIPPHTRKIKTQRMDSYFVLLNYEKYSRVSVYAILSHVYYYTNGKGGRKKTVSAFRVRTNELLLKPWVKRMSLNVPPLFPQQRRLLYDHVYRHNNLDDRSYQMWASRIFDKSVTLPLGYAAEEENEWVNSWTVMPYATYDVANSIIAKIREAAAGKKIPPLPLKEKGVYTGTFYIDRIAYPVAIYSEKDTVKNLRKVQIASANEIETPGNVRYLLSDSLGKPYKGKHIRYDDTHAKYVLFAFYEEGFIEPALIMQVEKAAEYYKRSTLAEWLKFLGILQEPEGK